MPPPVPLPPVTLTIPARTAVKFSSQELADDYLYEGAPQVGVEWSFSFVSAPRIAGELLVTLPSR